MGEQNIDPDKFAIYLSTLDDKGKAIVNKIVANTIYITKDELLHSLRRCLKRLDGIPYNLYIPEGKIGSEHWLILQLRNDLNPVNKYYGIDDLRERLNNTYPIVLIDDAIYSSVNMCATIDTQIRWRSKIKNKVYCVVAVTSTLNCQVATDGYFNAEIIADKNLEPLQVCNLLGSDYDSKYMHKAFGCESSNVLPLYFDHKIANEFGSYKFYHDIIKIPIDRSPISAIREEEIRAYCAS